MACERPTVLIVDDEQVVCDVRYDELGERGFLCITATNGDEALMELAAQVFDVVLLDIKLPGISGMEVLEKVCSDHRTTAAIMITGVDKVDMAVRAMKSGASDYIVKPFSLDSVTSSIHAALDDKKRPPKGKDYKTTPCDGGEEIHEQTLEESFSHVDAIACGVEARLDPFSSYSKMVTQDTIDIARQLGIAEEQIQRWAAAKAKLVSERDRRIKSSLSKLERSPLAQSILGMTELHVRTSKSNEPQN